jgi:hypothetical protein
MEREAYIIGEDGMGAMRKNAEVRIGCKRLKNNLR